MRTKLLCYIISICLMSSFLALYAYATDSCPICGHWMMLYEYDYYTDDNASTHTHYYGSYRKCMATNCVGRKILYEYEVTSTHVPNWYVVNVYHANGRDFYTALRKCSKCDHYYTSYQNSVPCDGGSNCGNVVIAGLPDEPR